MRIGSPNSRARATPGVARKDFESRRTPSRRYLASSATFYRLAIDRLRKWRRSGKSAPLACWLPHSATTNFSPFATYQARDAVGKFVKAECLHQHAGRVRSPDSREPSEG